MAFFREGDLGDAFAPFAALREHLGYVPAIYRAQSLLPGLIEAEHRLAISIVFRESALARVQKERLLLVLAAANGSAYNAVSHYQMLSLLGEAEERLNQLVYDFRSAGLPAEEVSLMEFATRLVLNGPAILRKDVADLVAQGLAGETILETVLLAGWAAFLATLSAGTGASPDFEPVEMPPGAVFVPEAAASEESADSGLPHLEAPELSPDAFAPFASLRDHFGFVPNVFRAQASSPEAIAAEVEAIRLVLLAEDHLSRIQKERILLAVSAANRNTYFVAVHSEVAGILGMDPEEADRLAVEYRDSGLAASEIALLDFAMKLAQEPGRIGAQGVARLRDHGFTEEQILEAVAMTALTNFLNMVQFGLGAVPDFPPRRVFPRISTKVANLSALKARPTNEVGTADPDSAVVARVQKGDHEAFEELINRHSRRVYRTLVGILGSPEEARDAMQDTFLKAFRHLGDFSGRSKFSTWLVSIASNTGIQLLRERKHVQSLDDDAAEENGGFRPPQIRAWDEDPEQLYSRAETRTLVENCVKRLPSKYRVVLMLRDIEQLSVEEAAEALGLGVPALKSRHLRGRMMLREALTPHFAARAAGGRA